jgi:hypothetical protein
VGDANPTRNLPGDDLPWAIRSAEGTLLSDGTITIAVHGLVFTNDPEVPPALRGINDEDHFRAIVSCLTEAGDHVATANVATPASLPREPAMRGRGARQAAQSVRCADRVHCCRRRRRLARGDRRRELTALGRLTSPRLRATS